jgi:hypothetical protein
MFLGASFPTARSTTVEGPSTGVPVPGVFWVYYSSLLLGLGGLLGPTWLFY